MALLSAGELDGLTLVAQGKVRDIYAVDDDSLLIVSTDRISAFDVVMTNGVPAKGKVLTQLTAWWLNKLEPLKIAPHHLLTTDVAKMPQVCHPHAAVLRGRSMLVKRLEMLPVEAVVRGYIAGGGWADYQRAGVVCGHTLPPGLQLSERLPEPIFTPSTKAAHGSHDENITVSQAAATIGADRCADVEAAAKALYAAASEYARERGILLADTKMEFGIGADGSLVLGDECFTPDCSRYWPSGQHVLGKEQVSYDKQFVRNYLKSVGFDRATPLALPDEVVAKTREKYVEIFRILTGEEPDL